jgi:uncharacterized protein
MHTFQQIFLSRLNTLSHIVDVSSKHFVMEADSILNFRIIDDMFPFSTQIVFACNQPRNFTRWCSGLHMENLKPEVSSIDELREIIEVTKSELNIANIDDGRLDEIKRIDINEQQYLELTGIDYVNGFLMPNLYFHMVTAYNIMRMKGVPLGKVDYMIHLVSKIKAHKST